MYQSVHILIFPLKDRPPPNSWKKIEQSREYKNGNQLREYQLEGLNWLLFNWYNRYMHGIFFNVDFKPYGVNDLLGMNTVLTKFIAASLLIAKRM